MSDTPFSTVCILGSGFMGMQIGLQCAVHGYTVWMVDTQPQALERAAQGQAMELSRRVERQQLTPQDRDAILSRIHFTADLQEGAAQADLVIEAVPERLELKREVFAQLDAMCSAHTILATTSSSFCASAIEDATRRQDKVLNMHFFPPVWQRPMAELMRGTATSDETMELARQFVLSLDLTPLMVLKESKGFLFNRIWRAIKKECLHIVDEGVASPEDVDRAWMIAVGSQIGPFGMMDMVGLDVVRDIEMSYYLDSGDPTDAPPQVLLDKIAKNELGIKTGKGFYTYPNPAYQQPGWLKGKA